MLIPVVTALAPVRCDLSGRKIAAYDRGERAPSEGWSWDKPVHDKYGRDSAGLYGVFPTLVSCLGGTFARSADLADADLANADVLVVIHPLGPWPEDRLHRVWDFVRGGGLLLVVAEPWVYERGQTSSFNELLEPTSMAVRFDTAIARTGLWQHALHVLAHPTTALLGDDRGRLGLAECASIDARWPARPLVVGRWGWSDPGSDAVLTAQYRLEPGERLGDLVLAAEERIGSGTVIVVGDATAFKNEGLSNGYEFVGRLLGYLAGHSAGTQAAWRQALGLLGCALLVALLAWRPNPATLAWTSLVLALALGFSAVRTADGSKVLPDGRVTSPNCLACIDASHLEAYRGYPWMESGLRRADLKDVPADDPRFGRLGRDTGIGGLEMNLMRNGYLPIRISELTDEQLQRAGLFVSIAPSRAYSGDQQKALKAYLDRGGIWVCMVGGDRSGPINDTLSAFGLSVPPAHLRTGEKGVEPLATAHAPSPYFQADKYDARLMFDSAWPVKCDNENSEVVAGGVGKSPAAVSVGVGKGRIVLIGDSLFAANRNLENEVGLPWDGVRENAAFWRWLIARLRDRQDWLPPDIPLSKAETDDEEDADLHGDVPAARAPAAKAPAAKGPAAKTPAAPKTPRAKPKTAPGKEARP